MSTSEKSIATVLIESAVRAVGKREFLKNVESIFGVTKTTKVSKVSSVSVKEKKPRKQRTLKEVPEEERCCDRVKGDISAVVGKRYFYSSSRCTRKRIDGGTLCAIHQNQLTKLGALPDGMFGEKLTEEQASRYNDQA